LICKELFRILKKNTCFHDKMINVILWWWIIWFTFLKAPTFGQCLLNKAMKWLWAQLVKINIIKNYCCARIWDYNSLMDRCPKIMSFVPRSLVFLYNLLWQNPLFSSSSWTLIWNITLHHIFNVRSKPHFLALSYELKFHLYISLHS
jgi:hypothetical protein